MKAAIVIVSLFIPAAISAQDEPTRRQHSIKLYNLISWERDQVDRPYSNPAHQREVERLRLLQPTVAYNWHGGNGNAQEIELTNLGLQRNNTFAYVVDDTTGVALQVLNGTRTTDTHIELRYEYIVNFNRAGISRWSPSVGAAIAPYFRQYKEMPLISIGSPVNEQRFGAMFFVVPRISYRISNRVHFDLNIPLGISDGHYLKKIQLDPGPSAGQQISSLNFQGFPGYHSLRAGIGVML